MLDLVVLIKKLPCELESPTIPTGQGLSCLRYFRWTKLGNNSQFGHTIFHLSEI